MQVLGVRKTLAPKPRFHSIQWYWHGEFTWNGHDVWMHVTGMRENLHISFAQSIHWTRDASMQLSGVTEDLASTQSGPFHPLDKRCVKAGIGSERRPCFNIIWSTPIRWTRDGWKQVAGVRENLASTQHPKASSIHWPGSEGGYPHARAEGRERVNLGPH